MTDADARNLVLAGHAGTMIHRYLVVALGGDWAAAALVAQIVYWHGRRADGRPRLSVEHDGHLWLARRHDQWADELMISADQAKRYTAKARDAGLIIVEHRLFGGMRTAHYRPNWSALQAAMLAPTGECKSAPTGGRDSAPTITETTTEREEHVLKDVATQGVARDGEPSEQGIDQPALVDLPEAKTPRPRKVKAASADDPDYGDRAAIIRRACGVTGYATPATRGQLGNFNKEFAGTSAAAFERMVDLALENIARRCNKSRAEMAPPSLAQLREFTSAVKAGRSAPSVSHAPINLDGR